MNLDPSNLPADLRDPLLNLNVHEDAEAPEDMQGDRRWLCGRRKNKTLFCYPRQVIDRA